MARLRVLSGPLNIDPFELSETNTTIGRAKPNVFRFEHRSVSKYHALIVSDEDGDLLFDLDSTNGTFLNNQRISSAPLKQGDHIRLGEFVVAYETAEVAAAVPVAKLVPDTTTEAKPVLRIRTEAEPALAPPPPPAPRPHVHVPAPPPPPAPVSAPVTPLPEPVAPHPEPVVVASQPRPPTAPLAPKKATGSQDKAFIKLPTDKKATQGEPRGSGFMSRVLGRDRGTEKAPEKPEETAAPPPAPPPPPRAAPMAPRPAPPTPSITAPLPRPRTVEAPEVAHAEPAAAPVDQAISNPPPPRGEQVIQHPGAGHETATGERVLKKPGGERPGDRVLLRPPAKKHDEITLKKPGAAGK